MKTVMKVVEWGIVAMCAFEVFYTWGTSLGYAWLVGLTGWIQVALTNRE